MSHPQNSEAIEVEVLAVDGIAPKQPPHPDSIPPRDNQWSAWRGRMLHLDRRWWPLWVFLGTLAIALLLTVGVVLAVLFVSFRIARGIFRALIR